MLKQRESGQPELTHVQNDSGHATSTAVVSVLSEGDYTVEVSNEQPKQISELLADLGISNRDGQLYLDGAPVDGDARVRPGSQAVLLPSIRGG